MIIALFLLYFVGIWMAFIFAAFSIGVFNRLLVAPKLGKRIGLVISTIILILVVLSGTYLFIRLFENIPNRDGLLLMGAGWVILTAIFEFLFLLYIKKRPYRGALTELNLFKGRAGGFVLLTEFLAPVLIDYILQKFPSLM